MQICQVSASFSLRFLKRRIMNIFFENLPFMSPRQPIKFSDLDISRIKNGGLLNKLICENSNISSETAATVQFSLCPLKVYGNYKLP